MGRPVSRRNSMRSLDHLRPEGQSQNGSSSSGMGLGLGSLGSLQLQQQLDPDFTCGCAAGWTGPTCEISEF